MYMILCIYTNISIVYLYRLIEKFQAHYRRRVDWLWTSLLFLNIDIVSSLLSPFALVYLVYLVYLLSLRFALIYKFYLLRFFRFLHSHILLLHALWCYICLRKLVKNIYKLPFCCCQICLCITHMKQKHKRIWQFEFMPSNSFVWYRFVYIICIYSSSIVYKYLISHLNIWPIYPNYACVLRTSGNIFFWTKLTE